ASTMCTNPRTMPRASILSSRVIAFLTRLREYGCHIRTALLVLAACFFEQSEKASAGPNFARLRQGTRSGARNDTLCRALGIHPPHQQEDMQWQRTRYASGTIKTPRLPPGSTQRPFPTA